ncbi:MAG: hypothetical protein KDK64_06310 [Chlamydiia bacterium]|nr:hypothetical protein [Chlamydiia bacterium]
MIPVGKTIHFSEFLSEERAGHFNRIGFEKLFSGVNLKLNDVIYNLKVRLSIADFKDGSGLSKALTVRLYSKDICVLYFFKPQKHGVTVDPDRKFKPKTLYQIIQSGQEAAETVTPSLTEKEVEIISKYFFLHPDRDAAHDAIPAEHLWASD